MCQCRLPAGVRGVEWWWRWHWTTVSNAHGTQLCWATGRDQKRQWFFCFGIGFIGVYELEVEWKWPQCMWCFIGVWVGENCLWKRMLTCFNQTFVWPCLFGNLSSNQRIWSLKKLNKGVKEQFHLSNKNYIRREHCCALICGMHFIKYNWNISLLLSKEFA